MARKRSFLISLLILLGIAPAVHAAGTIPVALSQQVDINGKPLVGCQLSIFQVGTTSVVQNAFLDTGLTQVLPPPLLCDQNGRLPMFYLADGSVHVRLTDAGGIPQFDYPSMLVIGPSSGGGGGSQVDPTAIAAAGDIKFRGAGETIAGWVKLNGLTIGSATSGATSRANADTQALFIYLWTFCPDAHCPVVSGRGVSALADFSANKQITLPDWRGRAPVGLDDMGTFAAGRLLASNVTSGGGDGVTTPGATGGEANHTLVVGEIPSITPTATLTNPTPTLTNPTPTLTNPTAALASTAGSLNSTAINVNVPATYTDATGNNVNVNGSPANTTVVGSITRTGTSTTGGTWVVANAGVTLSSGVVTLTGGSVSLTGGSVSLTGGSVAVNAFGGGLFHNVKDPFILGTWYVKL